MGAVPGTGSGKLVGRDEQLARLRAVLAASAAGARSVVLVSGESGIGKTALVRSATDGCHPVAWGTCIDDAAAPGYWPWSRALDHLVRTVGPEPARQLAGEDAGLLATIVPALGDRGPAEESARERWLLMDAVSRWLDRVAALAPVVIVLDDLHWADDSTLSLLDFVARAPGPSPLALVGCYRPDELTAPARSRIADFAALAEHIELGGLARDAVAQLVASVAGPQPAGVVAEIHRRAGGHPVFTRELALLDGAGDGAARIPLAVRDAIGRRLARLPATALRVLEVAALSGNDLHPDVIAQVLGAGAAAVEQACSAALDAGILHAGAGQPVRFTHDLYRETLAASVDAERRPRLHQAIGRALEDRAARGWDVPPSELARHFAAAVSVEGPATAGRWALAAAERDRQSLAFVEAAGHLRRWRAATADAGAAVGDDLLVDVLLGEADALARAGSPVDARGLLRNARDLAARGGDASRLASVALAVARLGAQFSTRRDEVVRGLEEALAADGGGGAAEARLTAALARELQHSVAGDRPRAGPLSERALELGRAAGDAQTLLACLLARHDVLWTPGGADERVAIAEEIVAVARAAGDDERLAEGLLLQANALLESGSAAYLPVLESCLAMLDRFGQPRDRYVAETRRAALDLLRGDLDTAAERIDAAAALGDRIREPDTANVRMSQRLELVRAGAVPGELAAFAVEAVTHWTGAPVHAHGVAAGFLARAGDLDRARHHVATVVDLGTWRTDRSYLWSVFVRELGIASVALGDHDVSAQLLADLAPLGRSCGVNGAVVAFAGSHAHTAGLLASSLGRDGGPFLRQAEETYRRLGAAGWLAEVAHQGSVPSASGGMRSMHRRGRSWHIAFEGRQAVVPHSKGLGDLAALLARPDHDHHVLELYGAADRSGPAGELADRTAIAAYRRRLADLEADVAEATAHHDPERRARAEQERQALIAELGRVAAPGGRRRGFSGYPAERARKAVTGRLRDAVRRLEPDLPGLAAHLDAAVVTGMNCRYRTDGGPPWQVEQGGSGPATAATAPPR